MSGEIKLKPCPFCGGDAQITDYHGEQAVACKKCGCGTKYENFDSGKHVASWNRRAPEPGTSVIRWTRYDGTPGTLPDDETIVLVRDEKGFFFASCTEDPGWDRHLDIMAVPIIGVMVGDLWAYLSEPPEGMA